jgi:hypothetical protein
MLCVVGLNMVLQEQQCAKTQYLRLAPHPKRFGFCRVHVAQNGVYLHLIERLFIPCILCIFKVPSCRVCWMLVTGNWWILDSTRYLDPAQPLVPFTRKA